MSHGWLTTRCPCYPFPQQQRPKTYRSTSTSTESSPGGAAVMRMSSVSSDPAICSRSAIAESSQECDESKGAAVVSLKKERAIQPCSSAICLSVAAPPAKAPKPDCFRCMMGQREVAKRASGGCKGKVGKAYVNFGEALVPCAFIVPSRPLPDLPVKRQIPTSTSIDLIDLAADDRYSNFNPGYKSTSPPEEELLVCPRSFCHHLSDVIVPSLPVLNELTEVFYEDMPGPLIQCQALSLGNLDCKTFTDKRHSSKMVRASWAGPPTARASPPPPPPPPPKTKLDGHETTRYHRETQSPQSPKFDETSNKRCRSQISKHPFEHVLLAGRSRVAPPARSPRGSWLLSAASPSLSSDTSCKASSSDPHFYWELEFTSMKKSGCTTVEKAHDGGPKALRERSASVTPPPVCNCHHPAMAGVLPLTVGGIDRVHSPKPDPKSSVPSVPYRLHKSQSSAPPVDVKTGKTAVVRHQKQTSATAEENHEGGRGAGTSRASADVLAPPSRDNKSSKQRCPTPPRVLSPGLGTIMCEDIAQI